MPPSSRVRLEVALPATVHTRAGAEAARRGQSIAAWVAEVVEVALVPANCLHGQTGPAAPAAEASGAELEL
jgi:hypothetical protein